MDIVLRSLLVFSLPLLSSGLRLGRLQKITSNSSFQFPALDVDTVDYFQKGNWNIGPTWEQWQKFERLESESSDAKSLENEIDIPGVLDLSINIFQGNIKETAFKQCTDWASPLPNQFDAELDKEITYSHMLLADHIYFVCVRCESRKFPQSWKGKVSIVDALEADKCLQQQQLKKYWKVTTLHKLIAWAGKANNFSKVMVLEEDFMLPEAQNRSTNIDHTALARFINSGTWDFLRFGHMPYAYLDENDHCKEKCLCTRESLSDDVCTPAIGCDIRSSAAYMIALREPIVSQFLEHAGVIDHYILQHFKQSFVVPAIFHQRGALYEAEVEKDSSFRDHCLRGFLEGAKRFR